MAQIRIFNVVWAATDFDSEWYYSIKSCWFALFTFNNVRKIINFIKNIHWIEGTFRNISLFLVFRYWYPYDETSFRFQVIESLDLQDFCILTIKPKLAMLLLTEYLFRNLTIEFCVVIRGNTGGWGSIRSNVSKSKNDGKDVMTNYLFTKSKIKLFVFFLTFSLAIRMKVLCSIAGCDSKTKRGIKSFQFPTIYNQTETFKKLSKQRQLAWLLALGKSDVDPNSCKRNRVCGAHFISGKYCLCKARNVVFFNFK